MPNHIYIPCSNKTAVRNKINTIHIILILYTNILIVNLLGLYMSWESFSLMHDSFSHIISAMPAILCFFHIHYSYYTIANLSDWYENPEFFTYPHFHPHTCNLQLITYGITFSHCYFLSVSTHKTQQNYILRSLKYNPSLTL